MMIKNFYKKRRKNQETSLFYQYFFLLFGFFGGNLWGSCFSSFSLPPFFFVIGILLCLEIMSYIYYKNENKRTQPSVLCKAQFLQNKKNFKNKLTFLGFLNKTFKKKGVPQHEFRKNLYNSLNTVQNRNKSLYLLKVGLVFGLFVDAFKVGS